MDKKDKYDLILAFVVMFALGAIWRSSIYEYGFWIGTLIMFSAFAVVFIAGLLIKE